MTTNMTHSSVVNDLRDRGLVEIVTHAEELDELFARETVHVYAGFDPTASSLHLGNLVPVLVLAHLQRAGHRPIVLVGGATGLVGDPSGKDTERQLHDEDVVRQNVARIRAQLSTYLSFDGPNAAIMVDNLDWIGPIPFLTWLREVGKFFSVNAMIAKESVKRRLDAREQGISYTEFSYQLLQAYDFWHLYTHHKCKLQIGGSDQWGNITAGIDYIHKREGARAYGLVSPLLTTVGGEKFGKSAGNAVWLDPALTSPYDFYQYWMRTDDRDVAQWLMTFTFLPNDEVANILAQHEQDPSQRVAQRRLAEENTRIVHGDDGLRRAVAATNVLFGAEISDLSDTDIAQIFAEVPSSELPLDRLKEEIPIVDLLAETICASKGEARRLLKQGGAYLNNRRIAGVDATVGVADLASETSMVLRSGKRTYHVVRFVS